MYVGEPPERVDVPRGGLICVDAMTPLQIVASSQVVSNAIEVIWFYGR